MTIHPTSAGQAPPPDAPAAGSSVSESFHRQLSQAQSAQDQGSRSASRRPPPKVSPRKRPTLPRLRCPLHLRRRRRPFPTRNRRRWKRRRSSMRRRPARPRWVERSRPPHLRRTETTDSAARARRRAPQKLARPAALPCWRRSGSRLPFSASSGRRDASSLATPHCTSSRPRTDRSAGASSCRNRACSTRRRRRRRPSWGRRGPCPTLRRRHRWSMIRSRRPHRPDPPPASDGSSLAPRHRRSRPMRSSCPAMRQRQTREAMGADSPPLRW